MFDVCRLIEAGCLGSVRGHALNGVCGEVEAVDGLGPGANSLNGGRGKNDRVVGHCFVNVADQVGLVVFFEAGLVFGDLDGGGRGQRVNGGNVRVAALAGWARFWNGVRLVFVFFHVNGLLLKDKNLRLFLWQIVTYIITSISPLGLALNANLVSL